MDSIVIKNVKILDKKSPYHNKVVDVQIEKGIYKKIGKNLSHKNEINGKGCILSHGFTDLRAFVQDPGEEFKEDYKSMEKVALAGGFTEICVHPFDEHSLQKKQDLEYLKSINKKSSVKFTPIAASTVGIKGDEISEMFDMKNSGALGFSNGNQPIAHAGVMNRLLQYASNTNTTLFIHAQLDYLVPNWQASEGVNNLKTGLKGLLENWQSDVIAAVSVAMVALPLALGVAYASGVPPMAGVVSAIIGGIVTTLFRGSHLAINGPAAGLIAVILNYLSPR